MVEPTIETLHRAVGKVPQVLLCSGPSQLHPKPRFYKHYWQVFTADCGWAGAAFFANAPRLSAAEFLAVLEEMQTRGQSCLVYGYLIPREGANTPFDPAHRKWQGRTFAPAWDHDPDSITAAGHK